MPRPEPSQRATNRRGGLVALLLAVEILTFGALLGEPDLPLQSGFDAFILRALGKATLLGLCMGAALVLLLIDRRKALAVALRPAAEERWRPWFAGHVAALAVFAWMSWPVFGPGADPPRVTALWLASWLALALSTVLLLLFSASPPARWGRLLVREWRACALAVPVGAAIAVAGLGTRQLYLVLPDMTVRAVFALLHPIVADATFIAPDMLHTPRFAVRIGDACSGYEGIALIVGFVALYLWLFRSRLAFPRALSLFPIGIVAIWCANILRITLLFLIGYEYSPAIAVHGFHSFAGWIALTAVALGLILFAHGQLMATIADGSAGVVAPSASEAFALLSPLVAWMAASLSAAAFSVGFDVLYPIPVVVTAGVLWYFRRHYAPGNDLWSWTAVAIGVVVFASWLLFPAAGDPGSAARLHAGVLGLGPAGAAVWIAFRVIGAVLVVPIAEELAFRGYLLRKLVARDFERVEPGRFTWLSFALSSILFGLLHESIASGTMAGAGFALALYRRGRLSDAVLAHVVANGLIAVAVLGFGRWELWV